MGCVTNTLSHSAKIKKIYKSHIITGTDCNCFTFNNRHGGDLSGNTESVQSHNLSC